MPPAARLSSAARSTPTAGNATCGTIIIGCTLDTNGNPVGGTKYWENNAAVNGGDTYLATSPLTYQP